MPYSLSNNLGLEPDRCGQGRGHKAAFSPSSSMQIAGAVSAGSESGAAADYLCEPRRAIFAFLRRRFQRYEFEIRRPEPPWTGKGFPLQMLGGTPGVAGSIEIERWRGPATLDRPGPLQDNPGKRAGEEPADR
jgi:hypothetical protein